MKKILSALAALAIAVPAAAGSITPEAELEKALRGRVAGKPVNCLPLSVVSSTRVIDRTAILYGSGRTIYVNRPRGGAERLREDDILVTRNYGAQICQPEVVNLIDRASRGLRGFVQLGEFVPYRRVPKS